MLNYPTTLVKQMTQPFRCTQLTSVSVASWEDWAGRCVLWNTVRGTQCMFWNSVRTAAVSVLRNGLRTMYCTRAHRFASLCVLDGMNEHFAHMHVYMLVIARTVTLVGLKRRPMFSLTNDKSIIASPVEFHFGSEYTISLSKASFNFVF